MAKYSKKAQKKVGKVMREMKEGKLRSGSTGKKVKSRKQAIAIGISEAREAGEKVPKKAASKKRVAKRASTKKSAKKVTKKTMKKAAKKSAKKSTSKK